MNFKSSSTRFGSLALAFFVILGFAMTNVVVDAPLSGLAGAVGASQVISMVLSMVSMLVPKLWAEPGDQSPEINKVD
jgi:hypothetical protein